MSQKLEISDQRLETKNITLLMKNVFFLFFVFCFLFSAIGCDAFRKKFVRKPKKDTGEEIIYAPDEYPKYTVSPDETYQMHFMIWEHWHNELLARFEPGGNQKKWLECIDEEIKNLGFMKDTIASAEKQLLIEDSIQELYNLREDLDIRKSVMTSDIYRLKIDMEGLGRKIRRELSYSEVKDCLEGAQLNPLK